MVEKFGIDKYKMSEIKRVGYPLDSITPDRAQRIERARQLTGAIGEILQRQSPEGIINPTEKAEKLGIYKRLGVGVDDVKAGL